MDKVIIHNESNLTDIESMNLVQKVINNGKVEETPKGTQYSKLTTFSGKSDTYLVASTKRNNTYTFYVYNEE